MSRVLMIASEAVPFAKTGGLADVVGALPRALEALGHETAVVLPRYRRISLDNARRVYDRLPVTLGARIFDTAVWEAPGRVFLIDCPELFDRTGLYGDGAGDYPDNHLRFAVLAHAALGVARHIFPTDILHCHDWQAGLVPVILRRDLAGDPAFARVRTVFTIHNLAYQGLFPRTALAEVGLDESVFALDKLEFFGKVAYIKGGIVYSDAVTTVSPTYAREIQTEELGCGLDGTLRARAGDVHGILNGVDYDEWNPETDPQLPAHYSAKDLKGKRACKQELLREFGLPAAALDRPLAGVVSRLTPQKGTRLIVESAAAMVKAGISLVVLGSGDAESEEMVLGMARDFPGQVAVRIGFDNGLAHRIEAGADLFLMPSEYEPCGLNQIYSLRYGTVPVVRATGGLDDTIEEDTGFKFQEFTAEALTVALVAAGKAYTGGKWQARMQRGMAKDFSWKSSAAAYAALYQKLLGH